MAYQNNPGQSAPQAWDRVGRFLGDVANAWQEIAKRNTKLWNDVSNNLRAPRYGADDMTTDTARAMNVAMENLEDLWNLLTRPPEPDRVARPLPTAFLRFQQVNGTWNVNDPIWIRVPYWDRGDLDPKAQVYIDGDKAGVDALKKCISVSLVDTSYCLEVADPQDLVAGVYVGFIAAGNRPLANLRIVVEG